MHTTAAGGLAVLGVLFKEVPQAEEAEGEAFLSQFWARLPGAPGPATVKAPVDGAALNAALGGGYYRYEGSLTTPPCTEGVQWVVAAEPMPVLPEQLARLRAALRGVRNCRPPQPANGREIRLVLPEGAEWPEEAALSSAASFRKMLGLEDSAM